MPEDSALATPEELAGRLFSSLVDAFDLFAVYLGDRLGYYRALATDPVTSGELAAATGTAERYAREWLEQQAVTGSSRSTTRRDQQRNGPFACRTAIGRCSSSPPVRFP